MRRRHSEVAALALVLGAAILGEAAALQDPPVARRDDPSPQQPPTPHLPDEREIIERAFKTKVEGTTKTPTPVSQAPSTVTVMTGDEAVRTGVRFLPDALRRIPGMELTRISSSEVNVSLRGYNDDTSASQGILGLVDGRSVNNEFFGAVIWDAVPVNLDDLERIEVVRGPGSFVHGPNAMHGLVNIVTKSPLAYDRDRVRLSGGYGSYRSSVAGLTYVKREGSAGFKATLGWDDINEFEPSRRNAKDKKFLEVRGAAELDGPGHTVDIAAGADDQKFNVLIPTFGGVPPVVFANHAKEQFLKANYVFGNLRAQVTWTHFIAESTPDGIYEPFETFLDTADADVQYTLELPGFLFERSHTVTAGTGYRVAAFENENENVSGGRHRTGLGWFFFQDEVKLDENLWFTGGLRLDDHSVAGLSESPRFALVWMFAEEQYFRGSAGYGFRNPSLRELWFDMQLFGGAATIGGNRSLEPEQMRSFELGYAGQFGKRLKADLNVYYNLVDRLVEFRPVTPTFTIPKNANQEEAYGAEGEVHFLIAEWISAFANYSFSLRYDRDTHDRHPGAPRHKANAGARVTLAEGLSAMVWVNFFDNVEFLDTVLATSSIGKVDEYALLNARIAYPFTWGKTQGQAFVQAFNVLDHDHREHPQGHNYGAIVMAGFEITW